MLHLILKSYTDEGFGRNVYKNVFFSEFIYLFLLHIEIELMSIYKDIQSSVHSSSIGGQRNN